MKLEPNEFLQIKSAIEKIEKKTSGELVTLVARSSDSYFWMPLLGGLLGMVISSTGLHWELFSLHWNHPSFVEQLIDASGLLLGMFLFWLPAVQRALISQKIFEANVDKSAKAAFVQNGLHHTKDETGVLIFVSLHEHRVEILADRGIHQKMGQAYWENEIRTIIEGIRKGKLVESLCASIDRIGATLAEHFPRKPGDTNELPDEVRT